MQNSEDYIVNLYHVTKISGRSKKELTLVKHIYKIRLWKSVLPQISPRIGEKQDAIGSCFIGGASAYGGIGTVPGVIVGAVLMGVINIGMSIMGVDANYQKVVKGLVLLAAVIFDVVSKKKRS